MQRFWGGPAKCHFFSAEAKTLNFWKISARIVCGEGTRVTRTRAAQRAAQRARHRRRRLPPGGDEAAATIERVYLFYSFLQQNIYATR